MKTLSEQLKAIRAIVKASHGCMCGMFESCAVCNSFSEYNKLRAQIIEVLDGPKPPRSLADYGARFTIKIEDLE